ncbi:MAG: hypothetical protein ABSH56_08945 [Bryobacteraceae bacterium]|jgi:hypothetical protein
MAIAIPDRFETGQALAVILPPEHQTFAVCVASGLSQRESAKRVGFHEDNGFRLMRNPRIRARVEELSESLKRRDLGGVASRAWIETQFVLIINRMEAGGTTADEREEARLQLTALMNLARLNGFIGERKQVSGAPLQLGQVDPAALRAHLGAMLDALEPGARADIQRRLDAVSCADDTDAEVDVACGAE